MRLGTKGWRVSLAALEAYERAQTTGSDAAPSHEAPKREPIRPVFGALEETGVRLPLPERWWEGAAASPGTRATKKAAAQRH